MSADLRIVVKRVGHVPPRPLPRPFERTCECHGTADVPHIPRPAATVDNARLQARVHADQRARLNEGAIPESYQHDDFGLERGEEGFTLLLWAVVCTGALVTGYSLGQLIVQAVMR